MDGAEGKGPLVIVTETTGRDKRGEKGRKGRKLVKA